MELRTGFGLFAVVKVQESCAQGFVLPGLFLSLRIYFRFAVLSLFIILTYNYSSESFEWK